MAVVEDLVMPEKGVKDKTTSDELPPDHDVEVANGHLADLEVDIGRILAKAEEEGDWDADTSPFPAVRAVVPETDDPNMPVNTFRAWFLGILFVFLGAGVNQFFSLRYPGVHIVSLVAELLAFPLGVTLARILPISRFNPDHHFNIKEHAMVTIMSNVSFGFGSADATNLIQASKFYGFDMPAGFSILAVICCQLCGYGIAGLCRSLIVQPATMIWPGVLGNVALLSSIHSRANAVADGWKITRIKFFLVVGFAAFVWYWFPGLIFTGLSYFTWICWIAPNNLAVNQIFGMVTGLGLFPLTFDWSMVVYNTNPLLSPHWAAANVFVGFVVFFWIVTPAIYYTNTWFTAYLPLCTADVYDRFGELYDTAKVITNNLFDQEKYAAYSPPYLPATFAFVYGLSFASITSVLSHVYCFHGEEIMHALRGSLKLDIHARLMKAYKNAPWYWWSTIVLIVFGMSVAMTEVYHTGLPVYGIVLAIVIGGIYMVPCGIIQGLANVNANQLNVLSEFIGGYMFQGKPIANILFKILSQDVVGQGLYFAADMKMGHYLKIPPRTLFWAQGLATVLGALTQVGVTLWMLGNVPGICSEDQPNGFSCPQGRTVYSSSVIWGLVGPARLYSVGKIYSGLLHFFWIGLILPPITYYIWKKTGNEFVRKINWPLIFVGTYNVPPATGINYSSWYIVNLIFNKIIYQRFYAWWAKYNYVLAAALDTGLAISGIVIFFAVTYGPNVQFPDWWGNTVWQNTADGQGLPWLQMPGVGYFGLANGTWS
ncbi:small oligopeptide transporter, OPT family [Daldinia caldariorum]|uniref:small oligopeptide transporter, OPT family n=1 Tax=Daldinia caldariorum TaxID=326644 RepID=UPI0020072673|nr:small oligopeptide transporter, OPT family [Daldinia caldariorum]KAI1467699.1 small oligopeptide transporter, OPT family [Daldinia caldariorum]